MKSTFKIEPLGFQTITELPNAWSIQNYKDLLEIMDYGDISDVSPEEIKEMCLLLLTDFEPEEAAKIVLQYAFKDKLNVGQIENLSNEILEESLWEEYADVSFHETFFNVTQLLYNAFNGKFPHPEAVRFKVNVTVKKEELALFKTNTEIPLIRLLVKGMPENTLLNRLYKKEINGDAFGEAKDIIWQINTEQDNDTSLTFEIISSSYWFQDFKYVESFESDVHLDQVFV